MKIEYSCSTCNASFTVEHQMDPAYYVFALCPYCEDAIGLETEEITDDDYES